MVIAAGTVACRLEELAHQLRQLEGASKILRCRMQNLNRRLFSLRDIEPFGFNPDSCITKPQGFKCRTGFLSFGLHILYTFCRNDSAQTVLSPGKPDHYFTINWSRDRYD